MSKRDLRLVTIVGVLVGVLVLIPAYNLGLNISPIIVLGSIIGFGIFAPIALLVLHLLSRFFKPFEQFGKFAAVGTLNTLIDLSVLNLLILVSGVTAGLGYALFKGISFIAGTTNSYFWNKFWTFGSKLPVRALEYIRFAGFTLIGVIINVAVATALVSVFNNSMPAKFAANLGALGGVFSALLWNFLMYRNVVFKKTDNPGRAGQQPKTLAGQAENQA